MHKNKKCKNAAFMISSNISRQLIFKITKTPEGSALEPQPCTCQLVQLGQSCEYNSVYRRGKLR